MKQLPFFTRCRARLRLAPTGFKAGLGKCGRKIWQWGWRFAVLLFGLMLVIDLGTSYLVADRIYDDVDRIPQRDYAVVLGTAKYYTAGTPNLYYKYRLDAAETLYRAYKTDFLVMSGDNKTAYYNEPKVMTYDLIQRGVPAGVILQDYAGYNTLDSVIRADKVLKLPPFTLVSQRFHCERALLIAKFHHIDAICYVATYPEQHYKVRIREFFARTAMLFNLLFDVDASTLQPPKIVEPTRTAK